MRLSEAILLGSTRVRPHPGTLFRFGSNGEEGCALGMAQVAAGIARPDFPEFYYDSIFKAWPWLMEGGFLHAPLCDCPELFNRAQWIQHTFDRHITGLISNVSLEQLCDWIRTIEPPEERADAAVTGEREAEAVVTSDRGQVTVGAHSREGASR